MICNVVKVEQEKLSSEDSTVGHASSNGWQGGGVLFNVNIVLKVRYQQAHV